MWQGIANWRAQLWMVVSSSAAPSITARPRFLKIPEKTPTLWFTTSAWVLACPIGQELELAQQALTFGDQGTVL